MLKVAIVALAVLSYFGVGVGSIVILTWMDVRLGSGIMGNDAPAFVLLFWPLVLPILLMFLAMDFAEALHKKCKSKWNGNGRENA